MDARETDARWERLTGLLRPIHAQAVASARRLCRSAADGDDLYQETVLRAFEKLHTLRDEAKFRSWFYATLLSRHCSRARRWSWRRMLSVEEATAAGNEPVGDDGAPWAEEVWRASRVARALATLAAVQREALVLFELDGYSLEEIAAMQCVSISAVKSRLARGRERLRNYYERHGWRAPSAAAPAVRGATRAPMAKDGRADARGSLAFAARATVPAPGLAEEE